MSATIMEQPEGKPRPSHYVRIVEEKCNGCVLCTKACPTRAIRVRSDNKARIEGNCIDCGECIRVCPRGAVNAVTTGSDPETLSRKKVILSISPVLYAQFGLDVTPSRILLALRKVFQLVYDQSQSHELYNAATEIYIRRCRKTKSGPWPLISPVCPAVNRLIAHRFPSLIEHILPLITPRELAARELRKRYRVFNTEDCGIYHVTPCSAKMISVKEPMFLEHSFIDGVLGINEVYPILEKYISEVVEEDPPSVQPPSGSGIAWSLCGGEIEGLGYGNCLAVSGMREVIRYLEKIEMGLLQEIDYMELRACEGGCVSGPMTVADRYQARRVIERITRRYGAERKVTAAGVEKMFDDGWFFSRAPRATDAARLKRLSISEAIERQDRVEKILEMLPRKECGACGSPDCRTFAEDVVEGRMALEACLFIKRLEGGGIESRRDQEHSEPEARSR